MKLWVLSH